MLLFPFILAFWAFTSFPFGLLDFHFPSFCPCGLHFLLIWPCGPSFPFILALWALTSFYFCLLTVSFWGPRPKLPKTVRFPNVPYKEFSSARSGSIFQFLAFCAFISFHFGFVGFHVGFHFLSFWPCRPSFPFILAFWAFISFHFSIVGLQFPFILALWAFNSFHFGLVGLHFLAFWPCGHLFPFILALWAFISFHSGLVGFHFLSFWLSRGQLLGSPPQVAKKGPFS